MSLLGNFVFITVVKSIGSILLGYMAMSLLTLVTLLVKQHQQRRTRQESLLPGSIHGLLFDLLYSFTYSAIGGAACSFSRAYGFEPYLLTVMVTALGLIYAGDERVRRMKNAKDELEYLDRIVEQRSRKKKRKNDDDERTMSTAGAANTDGGGGDAVTGKSESAVGSIDDVLGISVESSSSSSSSHDGRTAVRRRVATQSADQHVDTVEKEQDDQEEKEETDEEFESRIAAQRTLIEQRLTGLPVWFHLSETICGGVGTLVGHLLHLYLA